MSPFLKVENKGYQIISSWLKQMISSQKGYQGEQERCLVVHKTVFNFQNFPELMKIENIKEKVHLQILGMHVQEPCAN